MITDEEIIDYIDKHQVRGLHSQGCEWFWTVYMPALNRVVAADEVDDETIAGNFYAVGDVHDFNESPRAAIEYYKKALEFDPELNAAHREIANMYHRLGFIDAAIHHSDLALALWPEETSALADRINIDKDKNRLTPNYEDPDRPAARAREALAKRDPKAAINILDGLTDTESVRVLIWAHGANNNEQAYLSTWDIYLRAIKKAPRTDHASPDTEVWIGWGDFFFMPDRIWDAPEIWKIWMDCGLNFSGLAEHFEGLDERESDIPTDANFMKLSFAERHAQKIEYGFYVRCDDLENLKSIQIKYPNWKELNDSIAALEGK